MYTVQDILKKVIWPLLLVYLRINIQIKKPLTIVRPGTQTRRFTHISDTVEVCYQAFKSNKCKYYSITNKNSYSIIDVAKMFNSKIIFLNPRFGERYASALTKISNKKQNNSKIWKITIERLYKFLY